MTALVKEHGRQCMPCSINFSVILRTDILSTITLDFLKEMLFSSHLISCNLRKENSRTG